MKKLFVTVFAAFITTSTLFGQTTAHEVKQGETLYRLSVMYGITVEQILNANPGLSAQTLQIGNIVKIPSTSMIAEKGKTQPQANEKQKSLTHQIKAGETLWAISQAYGVTVDGIKEVNAELAPDFIIKEGQTINIPQGGAFKAANLKIAVILPIAEKGLAGGRALEFYRGFLLAAEDFKNQGNNVTIYTYEEPQNQASMSEILSKIEKNKVQLLVGPLLPTHFAEVAAHAKNHDMKVLIPFSSKVAPKDYNPNIFMLNAPLAKKNEISLKLFTNKFKKEDTRIIFLGEEVKGNEDDFTNSLKEQLSKEGYNIHSLPINFKPEDLNAYSRAGMTSLVIPNSSSIPMFKHATRLVKEYREKYPKASVALLGYSDWQGAAKEYRQEMHLANTYLITNSFFNPWSTETKRFIERYKYWFQQDLLDTTPSMGLLGYDSGLHFLQGLAQYGNKLTIQNINTKHLQSNMQFEEISKNGAYTDCSLMFIHYRTDGAIEKVTFQ
jgi:LysM repeat protein